MNEQQIKEMDQYDLLDRNTLLDLQEIEEPEERVRISSLLMVRARQLKVEKDMAKALDAYNKAQKNLEETYTRQYAETHPGLPLSMDGHGRPLCTVDNFLCILENDPRYVGLRLNLLRNAPEVARLDIVRPWTDADDADMRCYIEKQYGLHSVQKCDDAFRIYVSKHAYHPIQSMIESVKWDGERGRCESFLTKWAGAKADDYVREVSRKIFAGGIWRVYHPGCKFDDVPVLYGGQGAGKSTLIRFLAMRDEFFAEVGVFDGQKGIEAIEGAWIAEVPELSALTKAKDIELVKAYITRLNDRYRMPWDKRVTDHPRQVVFIGTTNREQFLTDKTGNRRFYPVRVDFDGYDLITREEECRAFIAQCWAEAKVRLDAGEMQPFTSRALIDLVKDKQEDAMEDDYRVGEIEAYLQTKSVTCGLDLWRNALNKTQEPTKKDLNEIGLIMQNMEGWIRAEGGKKMDFPGIASRQRYWYKEYLDDDDDMPL